MTSEQGRTTMKTAEQTRSELPMTLEELSKFRPEWRMGQLLCNLAIIAGHLEPGAVWDLDDSEALEAAKQLIQECADQENR